MVKFKILNCVKYLQFVGKKGVVVVGSEVESHKIKEKQVAAAADFATSYVYECDLPGESNLAVVDSWV